MESFALLVLRNATISVIYSYYGDVKRGKGRNCMKKGVEGWERCIKGRRKADKWLIYNLITIKTG